MMSGVRNILWLLPLLALFSWPIWGPELSSFLAPRGGGFETAYSAASPPSNRNFVMQDVRFVQEKGGLKDWHIVTSRLATGETDTRLQMEKVDAVVYHQEKERFRISGEGGQYDMDSEILTLSNNVRVTTADGYTIRTPFLQYHEQGRQITTRSEVRIVGRNFDIRGKGLQYDMNTGRYVLGGRVQCITW